MQAKRVALARLLSHPGQYGAGADRATDVDGQAIPHHRQLERHVIPRWGNVSVGAGEWADGFDVLMALDHLRGGDGALRVAGHARLLLLRGDAQGADELGQFFAEQLLRAEGLRL